MSIPQKAIKVAVAAITISLLAACAESTAPHKDCQIVSGTEVCVPK